MPIRGPESVEFVRRPLGGAFVVLVAMTSNKIKLLACILGVFSLSLACNKSNFKGSTPTKKPVITKEFTQISLPVETVIYTQKTSGEPQSEDFEQGEWGKLDLLIVVDNSGSMDEEQKNLASKLQPLLSKVEKADWQVAVVTTDPADGCQRSLIKKNDVFASSRFSLAVRAGTRGSGIEKGIYQAVRGLGGADCGSLNWVRPDSTVAVLIVSDEDNCQIDAQSGYDCVGDAYRDGKYLTDYLATIRTVGEDARVYGLIWEASQATCIDAMGQGLEYSKVVAASNGTSGSICSSDYTSTLTKISEDVAKILKYEFDLANMPEPGSLKIKVDGQDWTKFTLVGQQVKFTEPPPYGSKVDVSYKYGANGEPQKQFKIAQPAVGKSIKVTVNGVEVKDGYTWDEKLNRVEFATPPAEKADIRIEYKEKDGLEEYFEISNKVDPATVRVFVNGQVESNFEYVKEKKAVRINPPPPESASIKITFVEL
jgi:hypothetical protein